jgi:hypothetical protein
MKGLDHESVVAFPFETTNQVVSERRFRFRILDKIP